MFVIQVHYKVAIDIVEQFLAEHRAYLEEGYQKNYFLASGPKNPRTGGIIISQLKDRAQLMNILKDDPFHIHHIAEYEVMEFTPVKYHPSLAAFI